MKYTERDINLLIDDAERIASETERLDDKVLKGLSPDSKYTQDDSLLEDASSDLEIGVEYIKDAVKKLKVILDKEDENG